VAVPSDNSPQTGSNNLLHPTGEGVIIDIGTGDGHFVYQSARLNPNKFYIGIDASTKPLAKISEKIHRKPAKGGAPNVLFDQSSVEDLPSELNGVANEVHIHFPWGSLLRVVATPELETLKRIRELCVADGVLEVVIGLDPVRDASEIDRLGITLISLLMIEEKLVPGYRAAGFEIIERGILPGSDWPELKSSWAKRLRGQPDRPITYFIAVAV
jgi:16S rRNA (adenine(1408)-N(1))-methyltransferase